MFVAVAAGNAYGPAATEGLNALAASKYVTAVGAVWDSDAGSVSFASGAIDYSTEPDRIASFSQRHAGLDILAPGADILNLRSPDGLIVRSGTSMAAPLVAGAAVLVREMADAAGYPITPAQIRDLLRETGVWVFDGDDEDDNVPNTYRYYPRLDVFAALSELDRRIRAQSPSDPPSEPPPVTGPDDEDAPTVVTASDDNPPAIIVTPAVSGTVPALSLGNAPQHTPLTDWATRGDALIADGQITLAEHARYLTGASRVYAIPSGAPPLTFVIQRTDLRDNGPDQPPDAFEVALLDAGSQQPLVGPPAQLPHTDALLNIQADGRVFAAAGVTLTGQYLAPGVLDLNSPITVQVDLSGIAANTQALLSFDLVGFDALESSVVLEVPEGEPSINWISGAVYLDTNNNGIFDPDEIGLRDVLLTLTGPVERFALTGPDGSYRFDNLPDGVYTVTQTQPTGYLDGIDTPGTPLLGSVENDRFVDLDLSGSAQLVNYNFGELPIANSISGFVFVDMNNDGAKDPNEPGLLGVTITLTGPVTQTVVTVADGSYRFDELPDGVYTVSQTQPTGYLDGIDAPGTPLLGSVENDRFVDLDLSGNVQLVNYNFGELPIANSISGLVYVDLNNDGIKDPDEPGLPGVTITLTGPVEQTVVTAADGSYRFDELPDGVYTVTQAQPAGYLDGIDTPGTPLLGTVENDRFVNLDLSGNVLLFNYNFSEQSIVEANAITGFVYLDLNNDGVKDSDEPGLPGVTITLVGPVERTLLTDTDGLYRFDELPDGVYTVTQTQPTGYLDGIDTPGTPLLGSVENDRFANLDLSGNVHLLDYNFGELPNNVISGFVYVDLNNDGIKDTEEPGVPGVTITLTGPVTQTVVTAADGSYRFDELPDGVYTVTQTQPAGYLDGIDTPGTPLLGTVENDRFVNLDLSDNVHLLNYNFGERPNNVISGFVYVDLNNDGVKDSDEPGLPGVTITLTGPVTLTVVTGEHGSYRFDELPDGVYTVTQTQPAGYLDGIDTPGTPLLGSVENDRFANLDLSGNVHLPDYNFGERPNNVISGFVYVDLNNDGIKDTEEPGVPGVTITLTGPVTQTGVTAADGSYRFDELPDGVYTVTQAQPTGYLDGIDTPGTPLLGSVENDRFVNLDLSGNVHLLDYNFGERFNNSIAGIVYVDVNNNGIREPYELALPNVVISLMGPVQRTTLTGLDGTYRFSSLPDGIYTVIQTQPAEFLDGIDSPGQPRLGRVENDRFVDLNLSGGINATEYDFGERGMLFPDKTQFLASTPAPTPLMLARMVRPEGGEWFSVTAAEDATMMIAAGEGTNAPALELFTETMVPVAHGQQGMLQALVTGGATYLLRMDADGEAVPTIETSPFDATGRRSFHNASHPHDVSGDGFLTPLDPLLIINQLNGRQIIDSQGRFLVYPTTESTLPFFDTSNDGQLTALDALLVINTLNARSVGEGEAQLSDLRQRVDVADVELHEWLFDARNESSLSPTDRSIDDLAIALDDFSNPDSQKRPLPKPSAPAFVDLDDIELSLDEIAADVLHAMGQLQP